MTARFPDGSAIVTCWVCAYVSQLPGTGRLVRWHLGRVGASKRRRHMPVAL